VSTITANRKKFDTRANVEVFLGFKPHTKGYIVYDHKTNSINASLFKCVANSSQLSLSVSYSHHDELIGNFIEEVEFFNENLDKEL